MVCQYLLPQRDKTGLILATELMIVNLGIEACIRDRRLSQIPGLIQIGHADGMHTVDDSLIELLLDERISLMDAMAHGRDPNFVKEEFQKALKSERKGGLPEFFANEMPGSSASNKRYLFQFTARHCQRWLILL